jgi:hypothetical protein
MVRCARCRFLFEPRGRGLLPPCLQCGGATAPVLAIEPSLSCDAPDEPTLELPLAHDGGDAAPG